MDILMDWYSKFSIQGIGIIISLVFSIYSLNKSIQCNCNKRVKDENYYSSINSDISKKNESNSFKYVNNIIRLPKKKKFIKINENISLLKNIKSILEDNPSILTYKLNEIISNSMEKDELNDEQCISAMSYEFVSIYGSEKIQQADIELFCTIFSKSINLEYNGYVEFLIILKLIDEILFKAFEPKIILLSILLITSDYRDNIDEKEFFKFIKKNELEINKIFSSITTISLSKNMIKVKEEDVYGAIEMIKSAIVRRSSRIRKINK